MSTTIAQGKQRRRRGPHESQPSSRDASEEDNDESPSAPGSAPRPHHPSAPAAPRPKRSGIASRLSSDDGGTESQTYDGDVESSTSAFTQHHPLDSAPSSSASSAFMPNPAVRQATPMPNGQPSSPSPDPSSDSELSLSSKISQSRASAIVELPEADIRAFVERAIAGESEPGAATRTFKVNSPPVGRPVRIYADGVYDLFHYGHALQMRQAKLCFPSVHLIIGVNSDEQCASHKSMPAMAHAERCEAVKHCRWVDEVAPDAPWEITQEFLDRYEIDFVAHDEEPYKSAGMDDIYGFVKAQGRFLPTRRTPGISTSDLLERIVSEYRVGQFDAKLEKNGHPELRARLVDWARKRTIS